MVRDVRPERPDDEDAPHLSDEIWELAEKCWVKEPKDRPTASAVCNTLSHLHNVTATLPPTFVPSFSHLNVQANPPSSLNTPPNSASAVHAEAVTVQHTSVPSSPNLTAQANLPN